MKTHTQKCVYLCIYVYAIIERQYLNCMKLQLEHNFDLVFLALPPRRLEHFSYFTLNSTLFSDLTLQTTAGALPGNSPELRRPPQENHHSIKTLPIQAEFQEPNSSFKLQKVKQEKNAEIPRKIQVGKQLTQWINADC